MKKILRIALLFFIHILLTFWPVRAQTHSLRQEGGDTVGIAIRAMTFNIRFDNPADGPNSWSGRKEAVLQMINDNEIHLLGIQEGLSHQVKDIQKGLRPFNYYGVGRDDGDKAGEYSALFFDTSVLKIMEGKTFWLKPDSLIPGSGWDAACNRTLTLVRFEILQTGQHLVVMNTHFDHVGQTARTESAHMIEGWVQQFLANSPVILMGDFNCHSTSLPMNILTETGSLSLVNPQNTILPETDTCTFTGFDLSQCSRIDHILISAGLESSGINILPNRMGNIILSDHRPVMAVIRQTAVK